MKATSAPKVRAPLRSWPPPYQMIKATAREPIISTEGWKIA